MISADSNPSIALGRILGSWGVKGWVKVDPYAGATESALLKSRNWLMRRAATPSKPLGVDSWVGVQEAKRHGASVIAKLVGCDDRDAALDLKGAEVLVRRADFPPLREGEYYWVDLVGCLVSNPSGEALGSVAAVVDHGAHPILELDSGDLIPFVEPYLIDVTPDLGRIIVDWQSDWGR